MSEKSLRRRDKLAKRAKRKQAANKRWVMRQGRRWVRNRQRGPWIDLETADIHAAIREFLCQTTKAMIPNMTVSRVVRKEQEYLSDLAFTTSYCKIGYQSIRIDGEKVSVEAVLDSDGKCVYHGSRLGYPQTFHWTGLLPDPLLFDSLSGFVSRIASHHHKLMEMIRGSQLHS